MAPLSRRKPAPRRNAPTPRATHRGGAIGPGIAHAKSWAAGHVRAASYSRRAAMRMVLSGAAMFLVVLFLGLWLGGFLGNVTEAGKNFTERRLVAMGFVVEQIDVVGEGRIREGEVRAALGINTGEYLFGADMRQAQIDVQRLSWVDDAMVRRLWPNRIVVHIIEREPVALWQENGRVGVVDKNGVIIEAALPENFASLPLVVGKNAAPQSQGIYNALLDAPEVSSRLRAIIRVGERRWDIALKEGGPRLLLPEEGITEALARIERMQKSHRVLDLDLKTIDLRVSGRAVLRPNEAQAVRRSGSAA